MIVNLKAEKLEVGMFIDLTQSWVSNPFWKNRFIITSKEQIQNIIESGIKEVKIDTEKSKLTIDGLQDINIHSEDDHYYLDSPLTELEHIKDGTSREGKTESKDKSQKKKSLDFSKMLILEDEILKTKVYRESIGLDKPLAKPKWEPSKFMQPELVQAIEDKEMPPKNRAKVVYRYTTEMMKNILMNPSADVIKTAKEGGIAQIVDIILSENQMTSNLVKIISNDNQMHTHAVNVGVKSIMLAKEMFKGTKHNMHELAAGFFLHDIGKINIDPSIINNPGKLTKEEFKIMKTHPFEGYKILSGMKMLSTEVWIIAMQHHERENGSGYPCNLKGKEIHPYARICCITDVFDALTSKRPYKTQKTVIEALTIMKNEMLSHFNINLFSKFLMLFKQ